MSEKMIKKNKIYYGQYSLKHWIELILKKNIVLPEYQRFFVWDEEKTKTLLNTFKKGEFVPPVTIGSFKSNDENLNIIIDGQQRLTSILLVYLGLFPDKKQYKKYIIDNFVDENDMSIDDEDLFDNILEWTFTDLVNKGNTKGKIRSSIKEKNYKKIDFGFSENNDFWKNNYLGFSYLVPSVDVDDINASSQQRYYSSVFRNINIQGVGLLPQESRASLYYLNSAYKNYFDPDFSVSIKVNDTRFDFVRHLSLLSQYNKQRSVDNVARGYGRRMEIYYEEYIYYIIGESELKIFTPFNEVFPSKIYDESINSIKEYIDLLQIPEKYDSIIDLDMFLFGLIYVVMFKKSEINLSKKNNITKDIDNAIKEFKESKDYHTRNPGALKYLRKRIEKSIKIYGEYIV